MLHSHDQVVHADLEYQTLQSSLIMWDWPFFFFAHRRLMLGAVKGSRQLLHLWVVIAIT